MTPERYAAIEAGINSVCRKVLEVVPVQEPWSSSAIYQELRRQGKNIDRHVLDGVLDSLRGHGLIREPQARHYVRVAVDKPRLRTVNDNTEYFRMSDHKGKATKPEGGFLDELATLASELRAHAKQGEALAARLDDVALKVGEGMKDVEKLHALKGLLKTLS